MTTNQCIVITDMNDTISHHKVNTSSIITTKIDTQVYFDKNYILQTGSDSVKKKHFFYSSVNEIMCFLT